MTLTIMSLRYRNHLKTSHIKASEIGRFSDVFRRKRSQLFRLNFKGTLEAIPKPNWYLLVQNEHWKYQRVVWNLFKVNCKGSLLLILKRFHTLSFFHCWLWASYCWLGTLLLFNKFLRLPYYLYCVLQNLLIVGWNFHKP